MGDFVYTGFIYQSPVAMNYKKVNPASGGGLRIQGIPMEGPVGVCGGR